MARHSLRAPGLSSDPSGKLDPTPTSGQPQPRVSRLRRGVPLSELLGSDAPPPNTEHPLAGLSHSERQRHRLLKLAEVLVESAKRKAAAQASKGKDVVQ